MRNEGEGEEKEGRRERKREEGGMVEGRGRDKDNFHSQTCSVI